ncbi:hypothetical protein CEXT_291811 [Caerostris extrusa]|uniref:Uncharacterized protein n=1 Tax=Caerostris extrusa TaxID=172846 RepID=A0AAV4YFL2_CAEEX|nr:hypothetical protein CEXT_291811 [Caerostris extrusa]
MPHNAMHAQAMVASMNALSDLWSASISRIRHTDDKGARLAQLSMQLLKGYRSGTRIVEKYLHPIVLAKGHKFILHFRIRQRRCGLTLIKKFSEQEIFYYHENPKDEIVQKDRDDTKGTDVPERYENVS